MAVQFRVNRTTLRENRRALRRTAQATGRRAVAEIQQRVSRTQPVARIGGRLVGLDPSKPGEPPKQVTGDLRRSIGSRVLQRGRTISLRVFAGVSYAAYLEPPGWLNRPFLRDTLTRVVRRGRTFSRRHVRAIS